MINGGRSVHARKAAPGSSLKARSRCTGCSTTMMRRHNSRWAGSPAALCQNSRNASKLSKFSLPSKVTKHFPPVSRSRRRLSSRRRAKSRSASANSLTLKYRRPYSRMELSRSCGRPSSTRSPGGMSAGVNASPNPTVCRTKQEGKGAAGSRSRGWAPPNSA